MSKQLKFFAGLIILLLVLLYSYSLLAGADRFSMTPFREGQTAIASYYMAAGESPFLAYEVPVLGRPWGMPMEFPLFQWVAAQLGGTNIDTLRWTGRLLSLSFFGGCLWIAGLIGLRLPVEREDRLALVALLAAAPIFMAYSTAFLIESFALFFALAYLCAYLKMRDRLGFVTLLLVCSFGILAALSKPTTWAPFAGVIILATGIDLLTLLKIKAPLKRWTIGILIPAVAIVVPLIAGLIWVHFGDAVKMNNPLARGLTSAELADWNYGTLSQKLSPVVWAVILGKQSIMSFGVVGLSLPFVLIGSVWAAWKQKRMRAALIYLLVAIVSYISAPVVFTNLHFRHDYYLFANGFFLIVAFVLSLNLLRSILPPKLISTIYLLSIFSVMLVGFGYMGLRKGLSEPQENALIAALQNVEGEGGVIYFGFGWSSKMPYELERRALMLSPQEITDPKYLEAVAHNSNEDWIAIAISGDGYHAIAEDAQQRLGLDLPHVSEVWPDVRVFTERPLILENASGALDLLNRIATKVPTDIPKGSGFIFLHSFLKPADLGEGLFELIYKRGNDLFYVDGIAQKLYRLRNYF
ncbi:MAG: hypothetical protein MK120_05460 [Puniceicoccaceae bacterium]|nr:hypothetical protein [Puniceicoccaceae bacterium]